ncbi:MAG TPA: 3'-5' exonuclease [Nocardioides sp.]
MNTIVFLDTETTGLDSDRCDVWEIGAIVRVPGNSDMEYLWQVQPDLTKAEPTGLRVGRFYERSLVTGPGRPSAITVIDPDNPEQAVYDELERHTNRGVVAARLARILDGAHVVGAVPDFDQRFLRRFLARHGQALTCHYHLIDVEVLAVGYLAGRGEALPPLPWRSDDLGAALGVKVREEDRHTALGDARWVRDMYDAIFPRPDQP